MIAEDGKRARGAVCPAVENEGYAVAMVEEAQAALTRLCAIGLPDATFDDPGPGGAEREPSGLRITAVVPGRGYRLDVQR